MGVGESNNYQPGFDESNNYQPGFDESPKSEVHETPTEILASAVSNSSCRIFNKKFKTTRSRAFMPIILYEPKGSTPNITCDNLMYVLKSNIFNL